MEDILDTYALAPNPKRPLVNLDEFSKQLLSEIAPREAARPATGNKPGKQRRYDAEYVREGSVSAFMIAAPHLGIRQTYVGADGRRTSLDYAAVIEMICDKMFPAAEKIVLVQDNLNTHNPASLYKAFPPEKARRLAAKIEWHYTPKHGSWLNIAEIEISVLARAALKGRISKIEEFRTILEANSEKRNVESKPVKWQFTSADARIKLSKLYPPI
jgi:hypothetical protein